MGKNGSDSKSQLGRGLIWLAVGGLALGGGWYLFFNQSPTPAVASFPTPSPSAASTKKAPPATKPIAGTTRPVAIPSPPRAAQPIVDPLGPTYLDAENGFSVRFPKDWAVRTFRGDPWILDCGEPATGMISIGLSDCPASVSVDNLLPEQMARRIRRNPGVTLQEQGRSVIAEREAVWVRFTGPLPMTNGTPRMMRLHYLVPLQDGRALELRAAAPPTKYEELVPLMKQALETFRLHEPTY
jgi:hypothetical protein